MRNDVLFAGLLVCALAACDADPGAGAKKSGPSKPEARRVETAVVSRDDWTITLSATGTLRARRSVRIYNQESGKIVRLPYYEGDQVAAGEVLAELDSSLLQAQIERAQATLQQAESDVRRLRNLAQSKLVSEDELSKSETLRAVAAAELKLLRVRLGYTRITAPFSGTVSARLVEPGDAVPNHTHLLTLFDPGSLVAEIDISEQRMSGLVPGQAAQARIDALGEKVWPGQISRIHPTVDPLTRMGKVEIALSGLPTDARGGQFCRVELSSINPAVINIPYSALRRDRDGEYALILDSENRAQRAAVRSGAQFGQRIAIDEGLVPGQIVISKGFLGLIEGMAVQPQAGTESPLL